MKHFLENENNLRTDNYAKNLDDERWASEDRPYSYYTKIHDKKILSLSKEKLLEEYSYFYVCPFDELYV